MPYEDLKKPQNFYSIDATHLQKPSKLTLTFDCWNRMLWSSFSSFPSATLSQRKTEFVAGIFASLLNMYLKQKGSYTPVGWSFSFFEIISETLFLIMWKD